MGLTPEERLVEDARLAEVWFEESEKFRTQLSAVTAQRDALAAQLAALKKRVADAPRKMLYPRDESEKTKWVAVLDLEDGE